MKKKIILLKEKYYQHNYHNEKVFNWALENYKPGIILDNLGGFGCSCEAENTYTDYIDYENVIKAVPNLTEDEKEELKSMGSLTIYYCPNCKEWSMDGYTI